MNISAKNQRMYKLIGLFVLFFSIPVQAASISREEPGTGIDIHNYTDMGMSGYHLQLLADATKDTQATPESGTLVVPEESDVTDKDKKQCLNVCKKWGQDCIINPRTGARNCRRTCKEFGVECF